ncbi:cadmium-translocating P-type ATPase [Vibrio sp. CAIM 722]|uniref:Copper-exporting P-type ATPase n=1 Tax=Vibrio eleionomae TaxID=2653505 RepID=A0A7X4LGT0_9VIBR|nr:copper-translocating P-type ATPase [Vibrio eleionomae]MZI91635.1 cadmium-translocating P-type ATPase [Vibrio eleionomae]
MSHYSLSLTGLHCMGCARKLERQLNEDFTVDIKELSPTFIEFDAEASLDGVLDSVETAGFGAGHRYDFALEGLHCGGCVNKLTSHLKESDQIARLEVTTEHLTLVTSLTEQQIADKVAEVGFTAKAANDDAMQPSETDTVSQADDVTVEETPNTKQQQASTIHQEDVATHLLVKGMSCASCVSSVEKALLSVEGVHRAQVNLAEQSALVLAREQQPDALIKAITEAGYQAEWVDDPAEQQHKQQEQLEQVKKEHLRSAVMGLVLGVPLMLWGVFGGEMMITSGSAQIGWGIVGLLCLGLLMTAGRHFYSSAWKSLTHGRATMDTLVALGTGVAWLYSITVVLIPNAFPDAARHVYFEASAMIIGLISLGHYIEAKAKARTTQSLQALINLQPQEATLITDTGDEVIRVDSIEQGMMLRIKPGEKVAVDGVVIEGDSYVDESMLTGEPIPTHKLEGEPVSAGTINQDGSLVIKATGIGSQTMLSRIIQLVRQAQSSKPAIAKLADRISSVFVPVVVGIAIVTAAIWYMVGPEPKISYMLVAATTVLIIACPCALGLATPLSVTVGVGKAAELGILIKDANVLQSASQIDTVVFDKTGTLTQGKPSVQSVDVLSGTPEDLLKLAYGLEQQSEHPLAKAICIYAKEQQLSPMVTEQFANQRGKGLSAMINGQHVLIGSTTYIQELGIELDKVQTALEQYQNNAWTPVLIAIDQQIIGSIAIADPIKPEAKQAITTLNNMGIHTVMLTGDQQGVADAIGQEIGIKQIIAQVKPDEKAEHIAALQQLGRKVAMAGDGINDAPALAQADIGVAMGSGSDVAIESAQMTLLNSSPAAIANAIELSKATVKNIHQNLFGAFIYNTIGIPIAAGVLYPAFGFMLSPVIAGAAMALSSITVVSNANRLRLFKVQN